MYPTSPSVRGERSLLNHYGSINSLLLLLLCIKHHYYYIAITNSIITITTTIHIALLLYSTINSSVSARMRASHTITNSIYY